MSNLSRASTAEIGIRRHRGPGLAPRLELVALLGLVVVGCGSRQVLGQQVRALELDVVLGSDGWLTRGLATHRELEGAFFTLSWHRDLARDPPQGSDFITRFQRAYGREPDEVAALTYDAFGVLFQAIADAGRAEPESIREALSRLDGFPGVTGPITYRGRGGDPRRHAVVVRLEEGALRAFKRIGIGEEP